MSKIRITILFVLLHCSCLLFGQAFFNLSGLSREEQMSMQRMEWRYVPENDDEWDFTGLDVLDEDGLTYYHLSDSTLLEVRPDAMIECHIVGDSLFLSRYETPLTRLVYDSPICLLTGSMSIGDSILSDFSASGTYCNKFAVSVMGQSKTKAERNGTLILQEGDTLRNALCLHYTRTAYFSMQLKGDSLAEIRNYTEQTDEYEWYVLGCNHPVYRSTVTECLEDGSPTFRRQVAFRIADELVPEQQEWDENNGVQVEDSKGEGLPAGLSNLNIRLEGNRIIVEFETSAVATVKAVLCDAQGISYREASRSCLPGEHGTLSLDANGLRRGTYVVYVNVNGVVVGRRVNIL